ncbi:MAG: hypothetical protein WC881_08005 [Elusimicrobiota bacterium]|jgi:hypothetical protein
MIIRRLILGLFLAGLAAAPAYAARVAVHVHKEAADWDPISVRLVAGNKPTRGFCERKLRQVGTGYRGEPSAAKVTVRSYPSGDDRWLVVAVHPDLLRGARIHLEARFLIQEGYLEEVVVAAVTLVGSRSSPGDDSADSFSLRAAGRDFVEQTPRSGEVELNAIDPSASPGAVNAGRVKFANFGDKQLGFVNFAWSVKGVASSKPMMQIEGKSRTPHRRRKSR